ncbi:Heterochromatin protein 1 [Gryllus bimaculatus]|nr:Heterochromatin protein 1 [Gryllus bimaculatus]
MSARRSTDSGGSDRRKHAREENRHANEKKVNLTKEPKREVEKIVGVTDDNGELEFGIKFKGNEALELVPARVANLEYPQQIIAYYEERLVWESRDGSQVKALPPSKNKVS